MYNFVQVPGGWEAAQGSFFAGEMHTSPVTVFPTQSSPPSEAALGKVMDTLQAEAL